MVFAKPVSGSRGVILHEPKPCRHCEHALPHRYTEAYEREWRQKERAARERVAATNRDLAQARAAQQAARVAAQADMARLEAQEFHRIVEENRHIEQQQLQKVSGCQFSLVWYLQTEHVLLSAECCL